MNGLYTAKYNKTTFTGSVNTSQVTSTVCFIYAHVVI